MDEGYTNKLQKDSEKFSMKRGAMGLFVLRVAFAFLSATSMLSFVATLAYVKSSNANATYTAGLSAIINAVAAWHYKELINVRTEGYTNIDSELRMDSLRHSDWVVTMPLLVLKMYALVEHSERDLILNSVDNSAFCAAVMILLGAYPRLGLDELQNFLDLSRIQKVVGTLCYTGSVVLLCLLVADLSHTYSSANNTSIVIMFFLVWPCYAVTALLSVGFRQFPNNNIGDSYPETLALAKDLIYSALDIFSKAVFAWYTCSAAFGKTVFAG